MKRNQRLWWVKWNLLSLSKSTIIYISYSVIRRDSCSGRNLVESLAIQFPTPDYTLKDMTNSCPQNCMLHRYMINFLSIISLFEYSGYGPSPVGLSRSFRLNFTHKSLVMSHLGLVWERKNKLVGVKFHVNPEGEVLWCTFTSSPHIWQCVYYLWCGGSFR